VGGGQPRGNPLPEITHLVRRERALGQAVGERNALDQLHHQEDAPLVVAQKIVTADHRRVVHLQQRPGLAVEALHRLRIAAERGVHDLDGPKAPQAQVLRAVDRAHPASPQDLDDLVSAEQHRPGTQPVCIPYR
jgi:hypothetical protein